MAYAWPAGGSAGAGPGHPEAAAGGGDLGSDRESELEGWILILRQRVTELERRAEAFQRELEDALASPERRFRCFISKAPFGIYRTTPDGSILLANAALVKMLGYASFEELAARDLESEGYHPNYPRQQFKEAMERHGEVRNLQAAWTTRDGDTIHVIESARVVRDAVGAIKYYEGTVQDITELKKARDEVKRASGRRPRVDPSQEP